MRPSPVGLVRNHGRLVLGGLLLAVLGACGAVFPEFGTPVRSVPPGYRFDPGPPDDVLYLEFKKAVIPSETRDGRAWDAGGSLPDVFAKLLVNKEEILVTPVQPNTLEPTWPRQKTGNYRIGRRASVRVEVWDSNTIHNSPICAETVHRIHDQVSLEGPLEIDCKSGARVDITVEPAHGMIGLGLFYEIRTDSVFVSRVIEESPAARAGLSRRDQIVKLMGKPVEGMAEAQVRSLMNSRGATGLELEVRRGKEPLRSLTLKDGPVYATVDESLK